MEKIKENDVNTQNKSDNVFSTIWVLLPMLLNASASFRKVGFRLCILQNLNLHSCKISLFSLSKSLLFCPWTICSQVWNSMPSSIRNKKELFPTNGTNLSMCSSVGIKFHFSGSRSVMLKDKAEFAYYWKFCFANMFYMIWNIQDKFIKFLKD